MGRKITKINKTVMTIKKKDKKKNINNKKKKRNWNKKGLILSFLLKHTIFLLLKKVNLKDLDLLMQKKMNPSRKEFQLTLLK